MEWKSPEITPCSRLILKNGAETEAEEATSLTNGAGKMGTDTQTTSSQRTQKPTQGAQRNNVSLRSYERKISKRRHRSQPFRTGLK